MIQIVDWLLYVGLGLVFLILCAGIFALFKGGQFGRTWSNRLMRARVLVQFIAILLILAGFWLRGALAG